MLLRFRPLERRDFELLGQWLAAPHVERWWREGHGPGSIEARYGPAVDGLEPTEIFVVEGDDEPIGVVQRYRLGDHPEWERALAVATPGDDAVSIDYLIGMEGLIGGGLGTRMIDEFVEETFRRLPDVSTIVVAVQQANKRSWRALEKAGFHRTWSGMLDSEDPSDDGPSYVYVRRRRALASGRQ